MAETAKFVFEISNLKPEIETLQATMAGRAMPIFRIFELLPINVISPRGQELLEARGTIEQSNNRLINVSSATLDVDFLDEEVGKISVHFPMDVQYATSVTDPPPLKWSDLRYVFDIKEDCNGKEAIQA